MLFLLNHQRRSEAFLGVGEVWDPGGMQDWICVVGLCLGEAAFTWRVSSPVRALQLRHVRLVARHEEGRARDWLIELSVQIYEFNRRWNLIRCVILRHCDVSNTCHAVAG